jgi:hypothetical protein
MSKAPIRTLTVCEGRQTLGFIHEVADHQFSAQLFSAQLSATGKTLGLFPTTGAAAQAINEGHKNGSAVQ